MTAEAIAWHELNALLKHASGCPMDTLHVLDGVVLQLVIAPLIRRSVADWRPWAAVLLLELPSEAYDLWVERWPSLPMQVSEGLRDLLAAMVLPTLLLWVARRQPALLVRGGESQPSLAHVGRSAWGQRAAAPGLASGADDCREHRRVRDAGGAPSPASQLAAAGRRTGRRFGAGICGGGACGRGQAAWRDGNARARSRPSHPPKRRRHPDRDA